MPPIQRKLTSFPVSTKPLKVHSTTQKRLTELKKVVSIKGGAVNFDAEELTVAKEILDNTESSVKEILDSLRRLSCFQITGDMVRTSRIGPSIR